MRGGFNFAIPSNFRTGFAWAQHVLDIWKRLPASKQRTSGYCFGFNAEGKPWAIKEVQDVMQAELATVVDNATEMTTYSWRRTGLIFAQLLQMKPEEMAAMGDWQTQSDIPNVANMPLHYSSAKYASSLRVKSILWGATPEVGSFSSWEDIPQERLEQAKQEGLSMAEKLLRQDHQPVWAASQNFKRLRLSKHYVQQAERERQAAEATSNPGNWRGRL